MRILVTLIAFALLLATASQAETAEPQYTEDVELFKKENMRGRMELLLGCWLMSREYNPLAGNEDYLLVLIKKCMQKITRRDSYTKVTSLIGKNTTVPKNYQDIVSAEEIASLVGSPTRSGFDKMLLQYTTSYEKDIESIISGSKGEQLKKQAQEQVLKRQKYYFGIIPANQFTHMLMLLLIAVLMVAVCTCWKLYTRKPVNKQEQPAEQSFFQENKPKHEHSFTKSPKPKRS